MDTSIIGVWSLRSFVMEDMETKERSEPFGPAPRGSLILHPEGHMAALITPQHQQAPDGGSAPGTPPRLVAYAGRYRLEPPNRLVTAVEVAAFDAWVGTDQTRTYELDGDRLTLFTPPGRMPRPDGREVTVAGTLTWERAG